MSKTLNELCRLPRNQLAKINKDEMIDCIMAAANVDPVTYAVTEKLDALAKELAEVKQALASPNSAINKKLADLQQQVNTQAEVIAKQQRFLEGLDKKERECNLVVLGVPDTNESLDGATIDVDKVKKVWCTAGASSEVVSVRRLGRADAAGGSRRSRPILVTVASRKDRDAVLDKAKNLKQCSNEAFKKVYIKKDVHPSVRAEWKRLHEAERTEKARPENVGCNIVLNFRERQLLKDGVVIDRWSLQGF